MPLWILKTNKQEYLEDCTKFLTYGVSNINYRSLKIMQKGDTILLQLNLKLEKNRNSYGFIGPYEATEQPGPWVLNTEQSEGIWSIVNAPNDNQPKWLKIFPWCVFLKPKANFINELRFLSRNYQYSACKPICDDISKDILSSLIQNEFLPENRNNSYRTNRGVWVRSRAEHMIDNWFAEHGIVTHYEHAIYINSKRIIPDWYIPSINTFVEFCGLKGNAQYDRIWKYKEELYQQNRIDYVTLIDEDLENLDRSIPRKIPQLQQKII